MGIYFFKTLYSNGRPARVLTIRHILRTASVAMPCLSTSITDFCKPCACTMASDCGTLTTFFAHGFLPRRAHLVV